MKILFVYPNITRQRSPQLGICMIAAIAHNLGHECELFDLTIIPNGAEISSFQEALENFRPDLLAVSCRSNEWPFLIDLLGSIESNHILKVFGGPHATVAPEEVIRLADIVVLGEGELTFAEILKRLEDKTDLTDIPGCWVKREGGISRNAMPKLIADLDQLPFPNWSVFDNIHYTDSYMKGHFKNARVVGTFEASRGCPYNCRYCTNDYVRTLYADKGKWRREKSPERIVQEMKQFREQYGLDCVYWIDEILLTNTKRLTNFKNLYSAEIGVPFVFMERPENMTDEKVRLIKQAGAQQVSIGIESGDENLRRTTLSRRHTQETIISAFKTARKHGLYTHAFTMVGFPGQDRESYLKTFELLKQARPDSTQATIFYPLRRTKLFDETVTDGLFDPGRPMPANYYDDSCLDFSESQKREIILWQSVLSHYNRSIMTVIVRIPSTRLVLPFLRVLTLWFKLQNKIKLDGFASTWKAITRRLRLQ